MDNKIPAAGIVAAEDYTQNLSAERAERVKEMNFAYKPKPSLFRKGGNFIIHIKMGE